MEAALRRTDTEPQSQVKDGIDLLSGFHNEANLLRCHCDLAHRTELLLGADHDLQVQPVHAFYRIFQAI